MGPTAGPAHLLGTFVKKRLWILLLILAGGLFPVSSAVAHPSDYTPRFQTQIKKTLEGINQAAKRRLLKFKGMNDSLEKTSRAAGMFWNWQSAGPVSSLLDAAQKDYPENHFTLFVEALILDAREDTANANRFFAKFLVEGRTYTDFEKAFLTHEDFQALRREIENLLTGRGISLRGHEDQIADRVPMQGLENYKRKPSRNDQVLNIIFLAVLLGGGVCLILTAFAGAEFWRPVLRSVLGLYLSFWVAYGIWLLDLAFGLPYGVSRFKVIPVFLGATALFLLLRELWAFVREKSRPLETGFKRCPHCNAVILALSVECVYCKRRL